MKRSPRIKYKIINGILCEPCKCGCGEYIIVGKTCNGTERRFIFGHHNYNHSKESREKQRITMSGEKNHNYKDGHKQKFHKWKIKVFERDNYICQKCFGKKKCKRLHAHHIKSRYEFPEIMFIVDNGLTLCTSCHVSLHNKGNKYGLGNKNACKNKSKKVNF